MTALPAAGRTRLAKLLGMLGSDHAGERDAAGLAAHRLITRAGVTWGELLARPEPKREPQFSTWRATCAELMQRQGDLRPWERKFVADLPAFPRISTKQRYVLGEIADRVLKREAA
jgi:hypothetical protein